jgi:flagellar biosynthesis protein FlhF
MRLETFRGSDLSSISDSARRSFGDDAMIVRTRVLRTGSEPLIEVVAAAARDVEQFKATLEPGPLGQPGARSVERRMDDAPLHGPRPTLPARPFVLALVGPTGAGKTTTTAKLASHDEALGGSRVGLITLDTYRVGAVEQLETYAEIAGLPMEVVYEATDVPAAMRRLSRCDLIIVDAPGRSPAAVEHNAQWREALALLAPDEVHLVIPATMRPDVAEAVRDTILPDDSTLRVTHALLTKLDEVPGEVGVAELAHRLDLPARWVTDGQEIPGDLRVAVPRLLRALGAMMPAPETHSMRAITATDARRANGLRNTQSVSGAQSLRA